MKSRDFCVAGRRLLFIGLLLFLVSACSINVKKDRLGDGKKVDIETPVGSIHVSEEVSADDTGLSVYPGARPKPDDNNSDKKRANVNISSGLFAVKVAVIEYVSDDPPEKLIAYYRDQLKRYGNILECHTHGHGSYTRDTTGNHGAKCDSDDSGHTTELKVGTDENQHIVAIQPRGKGSEFALIYVKTRGKDTTI